MASCIYKQRRHDDAAGWRQRCPRRSSLYQREGAAGVRSREKRRRRAWRESPSWSSSERHAREAPTRRADLQGRSRTPSARALAQRQAGRLRPPQGPGHLESRRSRSPLSVTRRAQRRARRRGRVWAAHCPARPYRVRRTRHRAPRKRSAPVFERAPTASSSGMLAMATPPTTPEINATARARTDRRGHHQPTRR